MNIAEIRKNHPEYDDMSDMKLADAIHEKHYSDMPKETFYSKIGLDQTNEDHKESTGWSGIGQDIEDTFKNILPHVGLALKELPHQVNVAAHMDLKRSLQNLGAGLGEGIEGLANTPSNLAQYLGKKKILSQEHANVFPRIPEHDYFKMLGGEGEQEGDALWRGAGSFLPFGIAGELGMGAKGLKRIGAVGAHAASQNENPLEAALMQGILGKGAKVAAKGVASLGKLRPSQMFRGELSPEELQRNLRATEGTNTPIGDVIGSPVLKKIFENASVETPFSGGMKKLSQIKSQVEEKANEIGHGLVPKEATGDLNELTHKLLVGVKKAHNEKKNALYKERNDIAEKEGHKVELPKFTELAKGTMKSIEESPLLQNDPKFRSAYNKMVGFSTPNKDVTSQIVNEKGNPIVSKTITPSISEAQLVGNKLYDEGQHLSQSASAADRSMGSLYKRLSQSIKEDVNTGIETRGSDALKEAHANAQSNYKKNFTPFLDRDIHKLFHGDKDPQTIVHEIIKPGKTKDQASRINKIQALLPEDKKNLLGYSYLRNLSEDEHGNFNPKKLAKAIESLGQRQFKALFPQQVTREKLKNFGKLRGLNEESLNIMHNPKTGARNVSHIIGLGEALVGGHGLLSGNPLLAISSVGLPALLAKVFNHIATSPDVRTSLVNKMIKTPVSQKSKLPHYAENLSRAVTPINTEKRRKPVELLLTKALGK